MRAPAIIRPSRPLLIAAGLKRRPHETFTRAIGDAFEAGVQLWGYSPHGIPQVAPVSVVYWMPVQRLMRDAGLRAGLWYLPTWSERHHPTLDIDRLPEFDIEAEIDRLVRFCLERALPIAEAAATPQAIRRRIAQDPPFCGSPIPVVAARLHMDGPEAALEAARGWRRWPGWGNPFPAFEMLERHVEMLARRARAH
ncbi:hypothetical protein P2H44_00420 [Albimonas sp. CAU 1670]|uniref:hypothetical protein n=1 Tax=Albimonas sp. CAU 1670 TaxID=3032599 RepID=UPI0023DB516E|nr:hypothetical protein [Albimonas sp. CAU 1670]MDF2231007.1 hypothetical protein [Albimonas sp. CAU 1670]